MLIEVLVIVFFLINKLESEKQQVIKCLAWEKQNLMKWVRKIVYGPF